MKRSQLGFLLIVLLAFALRIFRAGSQEIWGDEAAKLEVVVQNVSHLFALGSEVHPRFMHAWLFLWYRIFGFNELGLRTLPIFFGVLTVPLVFQLAQRITRNKTASYLSAVLLALSPFHVYYSQDITQYALLTLMVVVSHLALLRALQRNTGRGWVLYVITTALALHTHYYAAFAIAAQGAYAFFLFFSNKKVMLRWLLALLGVGALVLPWAIPHISLFTNQLNTNPPAFSVLRWLQIAAGVAQKFAVGHTCAQLCAPFSLFFWALFVLGMTTGLSLFLGKRLRHLASKTFIQPVVFITLGTLIPILLVSAASFRMTWFSERFAISALPLFFIGVGWGLAQVRAWLPRKFSALSFITVVPLLVSSVSSLGALYFDPTHLKSQYGAMMTFIAARFQTGDVLLLNGPQQKMLFRIYQPNVPNHFIDPASVLTDENTQRDLPKLTEGYARAWLVMTGPPESYDPQHRAELWLGQRGYKALYKSFSGAGAYVNLYAFKRDTTQTFADTTVTFDAGMMLNGVAIEPKEALPGGTVFLTFRWTTTKKINTNYTVFTHLIAPDGTLVAQADGEPVGGARPTNTWQNGEVILDNYALGLPENAAGEYKINMGFYDWRTGARVSTNGRDVVQVGSVFVR